MAWVKLTNEEVYLISSLAADSLWNGPNSGPEVEALKKRMDEIADDLDNPAQQDLDAAFIDAARAAGAIVDDDAFVAEGDDGAHVMAWVFIDNTDAGFEEKDDG